MDDWFIIDDDMCWLGFGNLLLLTSDIFYTDSNALLIRKDGEWWYIICLFDVKINRVVSSSLAKSESTETIYQKPFEIKRKNP